MARKRGLGSFTVGLQMSTSLRVLSFYYNYNIQALQVLTILAPVGGLLTYPKGCYEQTEKVELSQPKHNQNSTKDGLDLINALHQPTNQPTLQVVFGLDISTHEPQLTMSSHKFLSCDYTFNVQKAVDTLASARGFFNILKKCNDMASKLE